MELEHSPFRDTVTDIYINYLGEPAATGIILYREFIILATVYYTSFCNLGEFDAVKRERMIDEVDKEGVCKRKEKRRNGDLNRKQDKSGAFN